MTKLEIKSSISECESIRRVYQDIDGKIRQKSDELARVIDDWRDAASEKLSASDIQRALLAGALSALVRQKQRLEAEIRTLDKERDQILNDYHFSKCAALEGSID